eukprot:scaffold2799_cov159-Ochromonas_danica.AAC.22
MAVFSLKAVKLRAGRNRKLKSLKDRRLSRREIISRNAKIIWPGFLLLGTVLKGVEEHHAIDKGLWRDRKRRATSDLLGSSTKPTTLLF